MTHKLSWKRPFGGYYVWIGCCYFNFGGNRERAEADLCLLKKYIASGRLRLEDSEKGVIAVPVAERDMWILDLAIRYLEGMGSCWNRNGYNHCQLVMNQFQAFCGKRLVSDITPAFLMAYYDLAESEKEQRLFDGREAMAVVGSMLHWGVKDDLIDMPCTIPTNRKCRSHNDGEQGQSPLPSIPLKAFTHGTGQKHEPSLWDN